MALRFEAITMKNAEGRTQDEAPKSFHKLLALFSYASPYYARATSVSRGRQVSDLEELSRLASAVDAPL